MEEFLGRDGEGWEPEWDRWRMGRMEAGSVALMCSWILSLSLPITIRSGMCQQNNRCRIKETHREGGHFRQGKGAKASYIEDLSAISAPTLGCSLHSIGILHWWRGWVGWVGCEDSVGLSCSSHSQQLFLPRQGQQASSPFPFCCFPFGSKSGESLVHTVLCNYSTGEAAGEAERNHTGIPVKLCFVNNDDDHN